MPSIWRKTGGAWVKVKTVYRKTGGSWQSVKRVWRKTGGAWSLVFLQSPTPSIETPVSIAISVANVTTQTRRLTGTLYHWNDATSVTYQFTRSTNGTSYSNITGASGTSTNPATGSSNTNDQYVLAQADVIANTTNYYQYISKGINSTYSTEQTSASDPVTFEGPRDVTITLDTTATSATSLKIDWTATTGSGSYVVYYGTSSSPTAVWTTTTGTTATLTGLTSGTTYYIRVRPYTGASGNGYFGNYSNEVSDATKSVCTFAFGNTLHVSTNGYIGLGAGSEGSSDSIPSSGKYLAVIPRDLQQSSTTSIWYWSDTSKYTVRWEGYDYGNSGNTKIYQATFYSGQSYADVLAITVTGSVATTTTAYQEDGTVIATYSAALTSGQGRRVYFNGTATATVTVTEQAKSSMKQVTGLTSGSTDIGYTTLTTATNQNNFVPGTISVSGGSSAAGTKYVTRAANLTIVPSGWPAGTTFTYQWYRSREIEGIAPIALGTASTQSSTTIGEYLYCSVSYANSGQGIPSTFFTTTEAYYIVPTAPSYTLTNNANGTFTISSVTSTGGTGYYGTWGAGNAIASSSSPTANATNTTVSSGTGTYSVTLFSSVLVTYQGLYTQRWSSWESTTQSVTVTSATPPATPSAPTVTYKGGQGGYSYTWEVSFSFPSGVTSMDVMNQYWSSSSGTYTSSPYDVDPSDFGRASTYDGYIEYRNFSSSKAMPLTYLDGYWDNTYNWMRARIRAVNASGKSGWSAWSNWQ